jgi:D-beta-D-heptose 7-phosphate kinase / D-beta-D-heptose 1-phosphate adenosyltransferase
MLTPKVLVLGDLIIDEFVYGDCSRISPEAPVPVVSELRRVSTMGGAGNVDANLLALGANTIFWCDSKWCHKTRIIAGHQQVCRLDKDDLSEVEPPQCLSDWVKWCDVVVLSDYRKGVVTDKLISALDGVLFNYPKPLLVDPYNGFCWYGSHVTLTKPNKHETESVTGVKIVDEKSLIDAGNVYLNLSGAENVVITLGADGMALFDNDRYKDKPYVVKSAAQQVFDVTGAGDTAIAVLAYIWADSSEGKRSKQAAINWANKASGLVCAKLGTAIVTHGELFGKGD